MRILNTLNLFTQIIRKTIQYAVSNPLQSLTILLSMQPEQTVAKTTVHYRTYPLNSNATWWPLTQYADSHVCTAVLHALHVGLVFELDNGEYYELHYGRHKWDNYQNQEVFEYANSHYPNHWQGHCDPDITREMTDEDYHTKLEQWRQQHQIGEMLFSYLPSQRVWQGHLITDESKGLQTVSIPFYSYIYCTILHRLHPTIHCELSQEQVDKQSLTNYIRRNKLFGDKTPFCWKGFYEIGDLPHDMNYPKAKEAIIKEWNGTKYIFGDRDCWEMVIWFSQEYLKVPPEDLGGALGAYLSSPGHALRGISANLYRILGTSLYLFLSPIVYNKFHLQPHKKIYWTLIFSILGVIDWAIYGRSSYDRSFIHYHSTNFRKLFESWSKEIDNTQDSLSRTPFNFLLHPLAYIISLLPWALLACFTIVIYQNTCGGSKKNRIRQDIDHFLEWLADQVPGPRNYQGRMLEPRTSRRGTFMDYQQLVAKLPHHYLEFVSDGKEIRMEDEYGNEFISILFSPDSKELKQCNKIAFFIPGTASSIHNQAISNIIASHLVNALNMPVVLIIHRFAPFDKWPVPLYDTYQAILHFYEKYQKPKMVLAGYSSGGYFATLAALILSKKKIKVERLILFAPLLDISGELGYEKNKERIYYTQHVSKELKISYEDYQKIFSDAKEDKLFNDHSFNDIIYNSYPHRYIKKPILLRGCSPAWISVSALKRLSLFPETTIITGEKDFFKMDSVIFYKKLVAAGKKLLFIELPNQKHDVIWIRLYPIYLAQLLTEITINQSKKISLEDEKIISMDDRLKSIHKEVEKNNFTLEQLKLELKENPQKNVTIQKSMVEFKEKNENLQKIFLAELPLLKQKCQENILSLVKNQTIWWQHFSASQIPFSSIQSFR